MTQKNFIDAIIVSSNKAVEKTTKKLCIPVIVVVLQPGKLLSRSLNSLKPGLAICNILLWDGYPRLYR